MSMYTFTLSLFVFLATLHVYFTLTLSLFVFLAGFLSYSALFYLQKFNHTFIQKSQVRLKRLFFSSIFLVYMIFLRNCFCNQQMFGTRCLRKMSNGKPFKIHSSTRIAVCKNCDVIAILILPYHEVKRVYFNVTVSKVFR